jgi:predicted nucleic acid-binding protein
VTIVVDASVAAKWFLNEPGSEAATKLLLGSRPMLAPALIRIEVSNAILRPYRQNRINLQGARASIAMWHKMLDEPVQQLIPDREIYATAIELAMRARHTVADCLYLAVAAESDADVITADEPMKKRGQLVHPKISLLEGCQHN